MVWKRDEKGDCGFKYGILLGIYVNFQGFTPELSRFSVSHWGSCMEFSGTRLPELEVHLLLGKSFLTSGPFQTSGFKFIQHRLPWDDLGFHPWNFCPENFEINSKTLQAWVLSRESHLWKRDTQRFENTLGVGICWFQIPQPPPSSSQRSAVATMWWVSTWRKRHA